MGKLILVRHGESEGNVTRVFTTTPMTLALTALGRIQARQAAQRIRAVANPRIVIASPYVRARDTGMIIAEESVSSVRDSRRVARTGNRRVRRQTL